MQSCLSVFFLMTPQRCLISSVSPLSFSSTIFFSSPSQNRTGADKYKRWSVIKNLELTRPIRLHIINILRYQSFFKYLLKATSRGDCPQFRKRQHFAAHNFANVSNLLTLFQKISRVVEIEKIKEKYYTRMLWQKMLRTQPTASYIPSGCMTAFGRVLRKKRLKWRLTCAYQAV